MVLIALRIHLCHFVIFELFIGIVFCVSEIRISFDVLLRSHVGSRVVSHAFFVSNLELLLSVDFTGVTATCRFAIVTHLSITLIIFLINYRGL